MSQEIQRSEFPYYVRIETLTGQSTDVPIVFLTAEQVEHFLQLDFNRLAQEAGVKGTRVHVERATTTDYEKMLAEVAACLQTAKVKAA